MSTTHVNTFGMVFAYKQEHAPIIDCKDLEKCLTSLPEFPSTDTQCFICTIVYCIVCY